MCWYAKYLARVIMEQGWVEQGQGLKMTLKTYHRKRNFAKTPEPKGKISHSNKFLYVIQKHAASHLHYDFRLELNGVLLSWAVPKGPSLDPSVRRLAMHVEDHPVEYGHFEGIIPQGEYGGGTVMLWDIGTWNPEDENPVKAYQQGHLHFSLRAKKLNGKFNLIRYKKDDDKSWFLIKSKDKYAKSIKEYDVTKDKPNSVLTQQTMDEIAENYQHVWGEEGQRTRPAVKNKKKIKKLDHIQINLQSSRMPSEISPQLATLVNEAPDGNDWLHELKLDGYRILAFKKNNHVRLMSRNNKDWTVCFTNVVNQIKKLPVANLILDGEIVVLDKNQISNFQLLQNSIKSNAKTNFIYYIFDILYFDKFNLMQLPLLERKNILNQMITSTGEAVLRFSSHIIGSGQEVFEKACAMGLEGIVSKEIDGHYQQKRTRSWLKSKCLKRQEFVIGGYTPPSGARKYFGSLYLGVFNDDGNLIYCGNVGTGFNDQSIKDVYQELKRYQSDHNPFTLRPPGIKTAIWTTPKLVAEIEFSDWTNEGILRHPSFKGLRLDKMAKNVHREKASPIATMQESKTSKKPKTKSKSAKINYPITNADKVLYPEDGITKGDLAEYYDNVEKWILPYITNRPLMLLRCPEHYQECFFQKHLTQAMPKSLYGVRVKEKNSFEQHIYIKNREGMLSLVQMGALEIHPWGSRVEDIDYPDYITFDLDPAPNVEWKKLVETAFIVKKHLSELNLKSFVKTTGGKGLHVVIPIKPKNDWKKIKNFTHLFVRALVSAYPGEYVSEMSKKKRKGKIFIDYLRNQKGATAIAAYSTRARINAPISTPIDWDELTKDPRDVFFTLKTLPKRLASLKNDPWGAFFTTHQSLKLR